MSVKRNKTKGKMQTNTELKKSCAINCGNHTYNSPRKTLIPERGSLLKTEEHASNWCSESCRHSCCCPARHKVTLFLIRSEVVKDLQSQIAAVILAQDVSIKLYASTVLTFLLPTTSNNPNQMESKTTLTKQLREKVTWKPSWTNSDWGTIGEPAGTWVSHMLPKDPHYHRHHGRFWDKNKEWACLPLTLRSIPKLVERPWETPAATTAPEWIIGPSWKENTVQTGV